MAKLSELSKLIRSKNAGPFILTFDVMFEDAETYERVKRSGVLTAEKVAKLYRLPVEQVDLIEYEAALAFKATIPRPVVSGNPLDGDIYGCQQFGPLADLEVPD